MIMAREWIWQLSVGQMVWDTSQGGKLMWGDVQTTARRQEWEVMWGRRKVENIGPQGQVNFVWEMDSISFISKPGQLLNFYCTC